MKPGTLAPRRIMANQMKKSGTRIAQFETAIEEFKRTLEYHKARVDGHEFQFQHEVDHTNGKITAYEEVIGRLEAIK